MGRLMRRAVCGVVLVVAASLVVSERRDALSAQAAEVTSEALLKKQLSDLQKSKKLSAGSGYVSQFKQTLFSALRGKERASSGSLQYLPPGYFKWLVLEPQQETYISTGDILWKYIPSAKHAQKMPLNDAGLDFLNVLFDPSALESRYVIAPWLDVESSKQAVKEETGKNGLASFEQKPPSSTGLLFVKLIPKDSSGGEDFLYVIADRRTGHVQEIRIAFKNGNRNVIAFSGWSVEKMEKTAFNFSPPAGTAVDKM
jgi:outer membrane lipoprotein-sorting protein